MVDRDLILRKLANLEEYEAQVSEFRGVTVAAYQADWKTQRIVERTLQMAVEACADVANHVIADRHLRVPSTYAEAFEILGEAGVLRQELAQAMVRMARFRNILVHDYARIDPDILVGILGQRLGDFARFRESIVEWLDQSS
jgi:uncharacterized protein YutE (UPF0331/DUF86 family)